MEDGTGFRWLKIKDNKQFGALTAGVRNTSFMKQTYSRMDICLRDNKYGNLQNLTVTEYRERTQEIFRYIEEEYGVSIDDSYVRLNELEINCTFPIQEEFYKYHRVLRLFMYNLPETFKKLAEYGRADKKNSRIASETFFRSNTSTAIKIYDKSEQLRQTGKEVPGESLMRIEWVLKTSAKIKEVFGSNELSKMTDEKISEFYWKQFMKNIENRYFRWKKENRLVLRKLILSSKKENCRNWKNNLLRECGNKEQTDQIPVLLDINDLLLE